MDRPRDIARFETLSLIACILNLVALHGTASYPLAAILGAILDATLILWISRRRSRLGRAIFTAWFALGLLIIAVGTVIIARRFTTGFSVSPSSFGISLVALSLNVAALLYLWSKDATAWLRHESRRA